jgi:hypothetical protein
VPITVPVDARAEDWNAGVVYETGPWAVQLSYARGQGGSTDRFFGEEQEAVFGALRYEVHEDVFLGLGASWLDVADNYVPRKGAIEDNEGTSVFTVVDVKL